jgi:hypothetical protein
VRAVGEEALQPFAGLRGSGVGPGDAENVEAFGSGGFDQAGLDRGGVGQKSRSA